MGNTPSDQESGLAEETGRGRGRSRSRSRSKSRSQSRPRRFSRASRSATKKQREQAQLQETIEAIIGDKYDKKIESIMTSLQQVQSENAALTERNNQLETELKTVKKKLISTAKHVKSLRASTTSIPAIANADASANPSIHNPAIHVSADNEEKGTNESNANPGDDNNEIADNKDTNKNTKNTGKIDNNNDKNANNAKNDNNEAKNGSKEKDSLNKGNNGGNDGYGVDSEAKYGADGYNYDENYENYENYDEYGQYDENYNYTGDYDEYGNYNEYGPEVENNNNINQDYNEKYQTYDNNYDSYDTDTSAQIIYEESGVLNNNNNANLETVWDKDTAGDTGDSTEKGIEDINNDNNNTEDIDDQNEDKKPEPMQPTNAMYHNYAQDDEMSLQKQLELRERNSNENIGQPPQLQAMASGSNRDNIVDVVMDLDVDLPESIAVPLDTADIIINEIEDDIDDNNVNVDNDDNDSELSDSVYHSADEKLDRLETTEDHAEPSYQMEYKQFEVVPDQNNSGYNQYNNNSINNMDNNNNNNMQYVPNINETTSADAVINVSSSRKNSISSHRSHKRRKSNKSHKSSKKHHRHRSRSQSGHHSNRPYSARDHSRRSSRYSNHSRHDSRHSSCAHGKDLYFSSNGYDTAPEANHINNINIYNISNDQISPMAGMMDKSPTNMPNYNNNNNDSIPYNASPMMPVDVMNSLHLTQQPPKSHNDMDYGQNGNDFSMNMMQAHYSTNDLLDVEEHYGYQIDSKTHPKRARSGSGSSASRYSNNNKYSEGNISNNGRRSRGNSVSRSRSTHSSRSHRRNDADINGNIGNIGNINHHERNRSKSVSQGHWMDLNNIHFKQLSTASTTHNNGFNTPGENIYHSSNNNTLDMDNFDIGNMNGFKSNSMSNLHTNNQMGGIPEGLNMAPKSSFSGLDELGTVIRHPSSLGTSQSGITGVTGITGITGTTSGTTINHRSNSVILTSLEMEQRQDLNKTKNSLRNWFGWGVLCFIGCIVCFSRLGEMNSNETRQDGGVMIMAGLVCMLCTIVGFAQAWQQRKLLIDNTSQEQFEPEGVIIR